MVCLCVCLLLTFVNPEKTTELIEMRFGGLTRVGSRNHVLDGVEIPYGKAQFSEMSDPLKSIGESAAVYAAKGSFSLQ